MRNWMIFVSLFFLALPAFAQDDETTFFETVIEISDQVSTDGAVTVERAVLDVPGFIVIRRDNGSGTPGDIIGTRSINAGENRSVEVLIDVRSATPQLFIQLHRDNAALGVFEFGDVEDADGPITDGSGEIVTSEFSIDLIDADDQFIDGNTTTVNAVVSTADGWLVVHADDGSGAPGPVLGVTFVEPGLSTDVVVEMEGDVTARLFPMLHRDDSDPGAYEFGQVEGADLPVVINEELAVTSLTTQPNIVAQQQIVTDTFTADVVLSEGPGWLVIHADADGAPGPVIGAQFVEDGLNRNVTVELNPAAEITPVLWPMLHTDTGEVGTYEFGEVEGADAPVTVNGDVLTFRTLSQPAFTASTQPADDNTVNIATVLIDQPGWLVIHADNGEGAPGPVIGFAPIVSGLNENVGVLLDEAPTSTIFPMLHYDTDQRGVYEFGSVEGADLPVTVNGEVVVGPLEITE